MSKTEYIYVLHGRDGKPFYCGHTVNPERRLKQHVDEALSGGTSFKCGHICWLISQGDEVGIKIVDQCPADELADLEAWWIDQLGYEYFLYNGNGGKRRANGWTDTEVKNAIQDAKWERKHGKPGPRPDPTESLKVDARARAVMKLMEADRFVGKITRYEFNQYLKRAESLGMC